MAFLGKCDALNLQKINSIQYNKLVESKMITEENTQKWGEYRPNAICFIASDGTLRIKKVAKLMIFLGIWKANRK